MNFLNFIKQHQKACQKPKQDPRTGQKSITNNRGKGKISFGRFCELINEEAKRDDNLKDMKPKKNFSFRFDKELIELARKQAEKENRTLTNWIETLIKKAIGQK